ncbi:MAG: hypothetical protein LC627_00840 [Verrucomicrobiaceae bacterium]|nr:hypothetical protein [Verrucomicrobiaceae bacterium]
MHLAAAFVGAMAGSTMIAETASAQTMPDGSELRGATVQVELDNGVINTVTFNPDGTASIQGRTQTVPGRWYVQGDRLCLEAAGQRECWPYHTAFQNGQMLVLTSDCAATSRWTALSTAQRRRGERG